MNKCLALTKYDGMVSMDARRHTGSGENLEWKGGREGEGEVEVGVDAESTASVATQKRKDRNLRARFGDTCSREHSVCSIRGVEQLVSLAPHTSKASGHIELKHEQLTTRRVQSPLD